MGFSSETTILIASLAFLSSSAFLSSQPNEEAVMDYFTAFSNVSKGIWALFAEKFGHFLSLEEKVNILRNKMEELSRRESEVKIELNMMEAQLRANQKIEVETWLRNVQHIKYEMCQVEEKLREERSFFSLSHLGMRDLVTKKISDVAELMNQGQVLNRFMAHLLRDDRSISVTEKLSGEMTAQRTSKTVWEWLTNVGVGMIGVYGIEGVGKTKIMTDIYNQIKVAHIFDCVIWVTVSKGSTVRRLQDKIAKALGLVPLDDDKDDLIRSRELFSALIRRKKFVLILDDMWEVFPLEKVGIPKPNENNGCKIVLITGSLNVCNGMKCGRKIETEVLLQEEAWSLFKEKLKGDGELSPEIEPIAKLVTNECSGLPLAIITVARAMRQKDDIGEWRDALHELKHSRMDIKRVEDKALLCLKFSYDQLKTDKIRSCFLYCALYPEDSDIYPEELIQYWVAEGLIDKMGALEEKIDEGNAILEQLKDARMLEKCASVNAVKMHNLVRDLAISITRNSPRFIVKAGIEVKELQDVEFTKDVKRISFMRNGIKSLSGQPNCHQLSTLLLLQNPLSGHVSPMFFGNMTCLRVLDLSYSDIQYLPKSVSNLENLRALLLVHCEHLKKVPSLAKLKELMFLNLSFTAIEQLPQGMESLVSLRVLNLLNTFNLRMFQADILPKLSLLEHLLMWNSVVIGGGKIEEIESLVRLTVLMVRFVDSNDFVRYIKSGHWKNLQRYHLTLGSEHSFESPTSESEAFELGAARNTIDINHCNLIEKEVSFVLPNNMDLFVMRSCNLSTLPCLSHLQQLRECEIKDCGLEWLVMTQNSALQILPALQVLTLSGLLNLRALTVGTIPSDLFANLSSLFVQNCPSLKNLASVELLQNLQNLMHIRIQDCHAMEEMVTEGDNDHTGNPIVLPNLQTLDLSFLPGLKSISRKAFVCRSLHTLVIWHCPQLKKLPFSTDNLSSTLKGEIRGTQKWWDALEWDDPPSKAFVQPLFKGFYGGGMAQGVKWRGKKRKAAELRSSW